MEKLTTIHKKLETPTRYAKGVQPGDGLTRQQKRNKKLIKAVSQQLAGQLNGRKVVEIK